MGSTLSGRWTLCLPWESNRHHASDQSVVPVKVPCNHMESTRPSHRKLEYAMPAKPTSLVTQSEVNPSEEKTSAADIWTESMPSCLRLFYSLLESVVVMSRLPRAPSRRVFALSTGSMGFYGNVLI